MSITIIICTTIVTICLIDKVTEAIENCSYYKWKAHNPEVFMTEEEKSKQ